MKKEKYKPTILIDLDGVLNTYKGDYVENYIPPIKEGALDFVAGLYENYKLVLFTTRDSELAKKWLIDNGLDKYFDGVTNQKIPAVLLVDDRCVCFRGDYDELIQDIKNFRTWHND